MIHLVTPSLAYGSGEDDSLFHRASGPKEAFKVVKSGGRALVDTKEQARLVLRLLGEDDSCVDNALEVDPQESVF